MSIKSINVLLGILASACFILFTILVFLACPFWSLIPGFVCLSTYAVMDAINKAPTIPNS